MTTVLFDDRATETSAATTRGDACWVVARELPDLTGWEHKPEGVCRDEMCVPVPSGASWLDGDLFNLHAFAAHRGQAAAYDSATDTWSFGPPSGSMLRTGFAPDFELPDFDGKLHRLSNYRGKKVLLMTWASW